MTNHPNRATMQKFRISALIAKNAGTDGEVMVERKVATIRARSHRQHVWHSTTLVDIHPEDRDELLRLHATHDKLLVTVAGRSIALLPCSPIATPAD